MYPCFGIIQNHLSIDIAPDDGEGDGMPGCNEKNIDEYDEILPSIHLDSFYN